MFPIGVGPGYARSELSVLASGHQDNVLQLSSMDHLRMLLSLDHSYTDRICRGAYTQTHSKIFPVENE